MPFNRQEGTMHADDRVEMDEIRQDLQQLRHDVSTMLKQYADRGVDRARNRAECAADSLHSVRERAEAEAERIAEQAREKAAEGHERLGESLRDRPISSLLIAAGVGAVAGSLLAGRRK